MPIFASLCFQCPDPHVTLHVAPEGVTNIPFLESSLQPWTWLLRWASGGLSLGSQGPLAVPKEMGFPQQASLEKGFMGEGFTPSALKISTSCNRKKSHPSR